MNAMTRKYARDSNGRFANTPGNTSGRSSSTSTRQPAKASPAKPQSSTGKKVAKVAAGVLVAGAVVGGLKVNNAAVAANARYAQRQATAAAAAAAMRARNGL